MGDLREMRAQARDFGRRDERRQPAELGEDTVIQGQRYLPVYSAIQTCRSLSSNSTDPSSAASSGYVTSCGTSTGEGDLVRAVRGSAAPSDGQLSWGARTWATCLDLQDEGDQSADESDMLRRRYRRWGTRRVGGTG